MKKIFWLAILLAFCASSFAQKKSTSSTSKNNIVKFGLNTYFNQDPFALGLSWESKLKNNNSIQIDFCPRLRSYNNKKNSGVGIGVSYRKYISKNTGGLQGLYISPLLKYGYFSKNYYSYPKDQKINSLNFALLFGKQWIFKNGFSLDVNSGVGFYNNFGEKYIYYFDPPATRRKFSDFGISPNLNIKAGFSF